jgi:hypothetical protein
MPSEIDFGRDFGMASCAGLRRFSGFLAVVSCVSAYLMAAAGPAAATGASAPGSIVFAKSKDIYLSTPDGSAQVRVTTDGSTPTADHTGDTGYSVPSESDNGLLVAVRNQEINAGQSGEYTQGYLWELDRSGNVIRKFKPPQFDYISSGCPTPAAQLPLGIINAVVSPDGKYIAYTGQTYVQGVCGDVVQGYSSWVVKSDGTGGRMLNDGTSDTASLEIGQWTADSSKLLLDRADFGSIADYYVNVPGFDTHVWTAPASDDYIDEAYGQPDVRGGILATEGYSELTSRNALRLWTTSNFTSDPTMKCDYSSPVADGGFSDLELISRPAVAPDGSYVAWEDSSSDGTVAKTGQGIYLLPTSTINSNCSTASTLFIARGEDPFWTPAGIYGPPVVSFTGQPPAVTNATTAHLQFTAHEPDPARTVGYTCSLDGAAPQACTSPQDLSDLGDGTHTFTVVASDGAQTGTGQVTWQVDTQAPTVAMTAPTNAATVGTSAKVDWAGTDAGAGIAHYALRYRRAAYNSGFGAWTQPSAWQNLTARAVTATGLSRGYDYCYSVSAVDKAGNSSAWSSARCTAVPLDDRALTASRGWRSITGSAYYNHTARTATAHGSTLSRASATLDRVALLATTCRGCGTVGVYVGKQLLARVSLAATATHNRVLKPLPVFRMRTGTVSVKVLTSGKRVTVDGLLISRT